MTKYIFYGLLSFAALAVVAATSTVIFKSLSPTLTLSKAEWVCTKEDLVPYVTFISAGKVMIPIAHTRERCDQWSRK